MSERKHAAVQRNEATALDSTLDQPDSDTQRDQLTARHDAMLALGQLAYR